MEGTEASRYWCHMCSQTVNPIIETDAVKCSICQGGFVEEIQPEPSQEENSGSPFDPVRAFSMWAPILLGMMGNTHRRHQIERLGSGIEMARRELDGEAVEFDHELESIFLRRRRNSATILRLLRDMRAGLQSASEPGDNSGETVENEGIRDGDRDRERVILINPFNQTIIVQGSYNNHPVNNGREPIASMGDYFVGPSLDLLLQHLSENDPNRYGTPPAKKEAVEALVNVTVDKTMQCSICLDDCEVGVEVKEMPCKHRFHGECILPWLELHSSCPVCRHQLPFDESKISNAHEESNNGGGDDGGNESRRQISVPLPWPFSGLFSSASASGSQSAGGDSTVSSRDANASDGASRREDGN